MNTNLTLVLDASTPTLFLGLLCQDQVLGYHVENLDRQQSEWMMPKLIALLAQYHYQLHDIESVIVGDGPGSFTGVRLALTLVKTLGLMKPLKVYPISTLALVSIAPLSLPWIDARGGRRYVAVYQGEKVLLAPTILDAQGIEGLKQQYPQGTWLEVQPTLMEAPAILTRLLSMRHPFKAISNIQLLNPRYLKDIK